MPCLDYQWLVFAIGRSIGHVSIIFNHNDSCRAKLIRMLYHMVPQAKSTNLLSGAVDVAWPWLLHSFSGNPQASPWPSPAGIKLLNTVRWGIWEAVWYLLMYRMKWNCHELSAKAWWKLMEWILCKAFNANLWLKHILIYIYIWPQCPYVYSIHVDS